MSWNWEQFLKLPHHHVTKDIHCVTKWSKFDTKWAGVSLDDLMMMVEVSPRATHIVAHSYDGYTTNLPIEDISDGKAMVATSYDEDMIEDEHGGPARLLVPHLYFWKSAKWLKRIEFVDRDIPGFWERNGYHNYGDPWQEQRYSFD
jgi:DMSO/TMAO reductase YedYZ molybdopterin-dependent catalytic subunit